MNRFCIYPKEISIILGKSNSYSSNLVRTIKAVNLITSPRPITIKEFCDYMDLPYTEVCAMINSSK
ncbi:hypothetical protein ACFQ1R_00965 [Mariniflexile jejuense]|uniref:XRE family transcriptional regulator n=1 Tax=Mariniflexile jejuense TaxID=1173582 RepID=A0ABW3JGU5_9FLAO